MTYLEEFLTFNCSTDILNILKPITSGIDKEVSESMTIFKNVKKYILKELEKNKEFDFKIIDLCAGNPLTSTLITFMFNKNVESIAIDIKPVIRDYSKINNFKYIQSNIFEKDIFNLIDKKTIIISVHACKNLSIRVIEIFKESEAKALFLMPCCYSLNNVLKIPRYNFLKNEIGNYATWSYYLSELCNGYLHRDFKCLSPKNIIISSFKN